MTTRDVVPATEKKLLYHKVREPARTIDTVPNIVENSLLSIGKSSYANYVSIFNEDKVNMYDGKDTVITVSNQKILKRWRDT